MKTIAIINQKGGIGKTSINIIIANYLTNKLNSKILYIDFDQQSNSTDFFLKNFKEKNNKNTIFELIIDKKNLKDCVIKINNNFHLIKAPLPQKDIMTFIQSQKGRESLLARAVVREADNYDYCIVDLPPTLTSITDNAIFLADKIFIITTADQFSIDGIHYLIDYLNDYMEIKNEKVICNGIILNKINKSETNINNIIKDLGNTIISEIPQIASIRRLQNNKNITEIEKISNTKKYQIQKFFIEIKKIINIIKK